MKGLHLPVTMGSADAIAITLAYSSRRRNTLHAEAVIAEQKYEETLIAARCYRLHMVRAKEEHEKIERDIERFRGLVSNRIPVINTGIRSNLGWFAPGVPLASRPHNPGSILPHL